MLVQLVNGKIKPQEGDLYEMLWLLSAGGRPELVARKRYSEGRPFVGEQTLNAVLAPNARSRRKSGVGKLTPRAIWQLGLGEEPGKETKHGRYLRPLDEAELRLLGFKIIDPPSEEEETLYKRVIEMIGDIAGQSEGPKVDLVGGSILLPDEWEQVKDEAKRALRTLSKFL